MRKKPQYEMKLLLYMEKDAQIMCKNFNIGVLKGKNVMRVQCLECLVL